MGGPMEAGSSGVFLQDEDSGKSPDVIQTDSHYGIVTVTPGHVSTDNSTRVILNAGIAFTGEWENIANYGVIVISTTSDVASAADGLMVQFSSDGTAGGIISDDHFTLSAGATKTWSFQAAAAYYRLIFTNGAVNQTSFNLQTILKPYYVKPSSHRIQDSIVDDDDAELVKAVLTGQKPDNTFVNFQSTAGGNFKISIEEFDAAVSIVMNAFSDNLDGETGLHVAAAMFGRADNDLLLPVKIDASTQDLQITEHEHAEVHSGDHYEITSVEDLAISNIIDIRITTPNTTKWGHETFDIDVESETAWFLHEGAVITQAGAAVPSYNNDRNSLNTAALTYDLILNVNLAGANADTDITGATELKCGIIGSGKKSLGSTSRGRELIFKQNTIYNLRLIATAAGYINYDFEWYEHTNKN